MQAQLDDLLGQILANIEIIDNEKIIFTTTSGVKYRLLPEEYDSGVVLVEEVIGDLCDLIGEPILLAAEETNMDNPPGGCNKDEEFLWTFYKFATRKGYVDIRWFGSSNGYYSCAVDFEKL